MNVTCNSTPCTVILKSQCVYYEGASLVNSGILTNDTLKTALEKIDAALVSSGVVFPIDDFITDGVITRTASQNAIYDALLLKQANISLTTTGDSGASTFITNVLNIPTYTLSGLGGQPALNGTGFVKITGTTISYDNSVYALDSNVLHTTGAESFIGFKSSTNVSGIPAGILLTNSNGTFSAVLGITNNNTSQPGASFVTNSVGAAAYFNMSGNNNGAVGIDILSATSGNADSFPIRYTLGVSGVYAYLKRDGEFMANNFKNRLGSFTVSGSGVTTSFSFVKTGGLASEFLKADGSVTTLANPVSGTGSLGQVTFWDGTSSQTGSNDLFWDDTNKRLGIKNSTPQFTLDVVGRMKIVSGTSSDVVSESNSIALFKGDLRSIVIGQFDSTYNDLPYLQGLVGNSQSDIFINPTGGNVALGGVTPTEKLDVVGNIKASGSITTASFIKIGGVATEYLMADGSITTLSTIGTGLITQTITNGDTTHAPSSDAVFDALATKLGTGSIIPATQVSTVPSTVYLTGNDAQEQFDLTETSLIGGERITKVNLKGKYQTGLTRPDTDVSVLSTPTANTLLITAVDRVLFKNAVLPDVPANKIENCVLDFGNKTFTFDATNSPVANNSRGLYYVGIYATGVQVYRTSRIYDNDVCYLARVLISNTAGVYSIVSFKYFPDLALNNPLEHDRVVASTGNIVYSGAGSISFGNRGVTYTKNSINYSINKQDPNYLQIADTAVNTAFQFLYLIPNITNIAIPLTPVTTINPKNWYLASGAIGGSNVANTNYQVYQVALTVAGNLTIQTIASTNQNAQPNVNAIFANKDDALAGLTSVIFPPVLPAGDSIVLGTFYLRAGTAVNGSQMSDPDDFYFRPVSSSSSSSSAGVTSHPALSNKNSENSFLHVTDVQIASWDAKQNAIPHLEFNNTDRTVWNNGKGDVVSNTSFGQENLYVTTSGVDNSSFGFRSFFALTGLSDKNTAFGSNAGRYFNGVSPLTTSTDGLFLGHKSSPLANNSINEIVIGSEAIGAGNNTATIGNTNITITRLRGEVRGGSFKKDGGLSTEYLKADGSVDSNTYAPLVSPTFTGIPTAPTAAAGTNTTQIATTAFVQGNYVTLSGSVQNITGGKNFNTTSGASAVLNADVSGTGVVAANFSSSNSGSAANFIAFPAGAVNRSIIVLSNHGTLGNGYFINMLSNSGGTDSDFISATNSISTQVFKLDKLGNVTGNSFVKTGGLATEYLKADGSVSVLTNPVTGTGAAGQVAFWNGTNTQIGDNGMYYDLATKRFGLGTTTPLRQAHFKSDNTPGIVNVLKIQNPNSSNGSGASLLIGGSDIENNGNSRITGTNFVGNDYRSQLQLQTTTTSGIWNTGIYLNENGNVGIGTTSPTSIFHAHSVNSNMASFSDGFGGNDKKLNIGTAATGISLNVTNSSNSTVGALLLNPSGGNVGIGTTSPTEKLDVVGNIKASGTITPSDIRLKSNILPIENALDSVMQMNPVSYHKAWEIGGEVKNHEFGFIAQEVKEIFTGEEIVKTTESEEEILNMNYNSMIAILTKALQEQQLLIQELRNEINALKS